MEELSALMFDALESVASGALLYLTETLFAQGNF